MFEWWDAGHTIIIITGRPECLRSVTELALADQEIPYHQLVMNCGNGPRVMINDLKPYAPDVPTALAVNLKRNEGLTELELP